MTKFIIIKTKFLITKKFKMNSFKETGFKRKNSKISPLQSKKKEEDFKK